MASGSSSDADVYELLNSMLNSITFDDDDLEESVNIFRRKIIHSAEDRKDLIARMRGAKLSSRQRFIVYYIFSVYDTKPLAVAMLKLRGRGPSTEGTLQFIESHICQYVAESRQQGKVPAVRVPQTKPGLSLLCYLISSRASAPTLDAFSQRPTFPQIALDAEMQALAREGYHRYCAKYHGRNSSAPGPRDRDRIYEGLAEEKKALRGADMSEVPIPDGGYTRDDLCRYLEKTSLELKNGKKDWALEDGEEGEGAEDPQPS